MGTNRERVLICSLLCFTVAACLNEQDLTINVFPSLPFAPTELKNDQCSADSRTYVQNLRNFTFWAHEMWDSTSKSAEGVLVGRLHHLGNFDECLSATAPFDTQFCLVTIKLDSYNVSSPTTSNPFEESVLQRIEMYERDIGKFSRLSFKSGWCIPASCGETDAKIYLNNYYKRNTPGVTTPYRSTVTEVVCQKNFMVRSIRVGDICFILVITVLLVCITVGSMQDITVVPKSNIGKLLQIFSLKENWAELTKGEEKDALSVLHAIRVFSSVSIVLVHRMLFFAKDAPIENISTEKLLGLVWLISTVELLVDTLYVLSGLLAVHNILKKTKLSFSIAFSAIASRYIRLTPTYGLVIFFYATVMDLMGTGPLWKSVISHESSCCRENWLLNLLYLNNYVNPERMCIVQSWSLSGDFHFFLVCLAICAVIKKNRKLGLSLLVGVTALSVTMSFVILYLNRELPIIKYWPKSVKDLRLHPEFLSSYIRSHMRASPYLLGAFAGYIYHELGTTRRELLTKIYITEDAQNVPHLLPGSNAALSKSFLMFFVAYLEIQSYVLALVSVGFIILPVMARKSLYDFKYEYDVLEAATYGALNRTVWAAGTCGLLLFLSYGCTPEWLNDVLLWKPFFVLSKLSYSIYLVHLQYILRDSASSRSTRGFTVQEVFSSGIDDVVKSCIWGLILYLAVEAPFRKLSKVLFKRPMSKISEEIKFK